MLEFGEKLSLLPSAVTEEDITGLRRHAFSDQEILSITLAASYRNYIIRIADSLGVELHRDYSYTSEILEAYNVSESEVRSTIYGDRLTASREHEERPFEKDALRPVEIADQDVCWIEATPPESGQFAELADEMEQSTQPHPLRNLASAFSLRPDALQATLNFGRLVGMGGSGLGRRLESLIGLVVAATQWVPYMGIHHAQALLDAGGTPREVQAAVEQRLQEMFSAQERELAYYCIKITREPTSIVRSDVEGLRRCGFNDQEILTIAASASFENFLCRVAAGLGLKLEKDDFAPAALEPFTVGVTP